MNVISRFEGSVQVTYGCFLFEAEELPQPGDAKEIEDFVADRGDGQVQLLAGCEDGKVYVVVEVLDGRPSNDVSDWTAAAQLQFDWNTPHVYVTELTLGRSERWEIPLPWNKFHLGIKLREGINEHWNLQLFPAG
ncbi:hypothetical protein [Lentzea guizhouensis]|uniref:hypothetical protein n=1 Tax=Lentzea guizhouensis TaxID=1586287 RepID=UPI0012B69BB9|nr:hypothetical protein [Lentzea guizhouensis]